MESNLHGNRCFLEKIAISRGATNLVFYSTDNISQSEKVLTNFHLFSYLIFPNIVFNNVFRAKLALYP